ncbi:hypothetical protein F7725_020017 [Dissostichus mawsoni]|uniref:Uncharacterized protein n=1 Tax=Dissostichus mawsoni TaxID=36200 RepID=A0A7J5YPW6_DISMA|nr:hypothetical protein F7725_020017 [Dissostichus mawsoni]
MGGAAVEDGMKTWWTTTQEVRKERGSPRRMKNLSGGQKLWQDHRGIQDHSEGNCRPSSSATQQRKLSISSSDPGCRSAEVPPAPLELRREKQRPVYNQYRESTWVTLGDVR